MCIGPGPGGDATDQYIDFKQLVSPKCVLLIDDIRLPSSLPHSNGVGQDIDHERVSDHLTSELVFAAPEWSLDQAADEMVRGGFRHVIVLGGDVLGILSMRDIVRCWTATRRGAVL